MSKFSKLYTMMPFPFDSSWSAILLRGTSSPDSGFGPECFKFAQRDDVLCLKDESVGLMNDAFFLSILWESIIEFADTKLPNKIMKT